MSAGEDTNARNPPQHASEAIIAGDRFDRGRWLMARDRNGDIPIVRIRLRVGGGKLRWDAANLKFTNSNAANALINPPYRKGWSL